MRARRRLQQLDGATRECGQPRVRVGNGSRGEFVTELDNGSPAIRPIITRTFGVAIERLAWGPSLHGAIVIIDAIDQRHTRDTPTGRIER